MTPTDDEMESDYQNITMSMANQSTAPDSETNIGVEVLTYTIAVFPILFPFGVLLTFYLSLKTYRYKYSSESAYIIN